MSEGPDREVLALLDRAAADIPPLHLAREDVVARGQQIVRRRRATAAGMGIAGLAFAGAVWAGLGGPAMLGTTQIAPAGTTWEAPDGVRLTPQFFGEDWPEVVLTKEGPEGYGSVTIGTGADAETVPGELVAGDLVQYRGSDVTVAVWAVPEGTDGRAVPGSAARAPFPDGEPVQVQGASVDFAFGPSGSEVVEAVTEVHRLGGSGLLAATGAEVVTSTLGQDGYATEIFVLPASGIWGEVEEQQLPGSGNVHHTSVNRPWWRGGGSAGAEIALLGADAERVRGTESGQGDLELFGIVPGVVEEIAGHRFGFVLVDGQAPGARGLGEDVVRNLDAEWAGPDGVWHRQDWEVAEGQPIHWVPREAVAGEDAGPGEEVSLLGKNYTVAVDPHGWPQLLDSADGSVLLRVTDDDGSLPSGGLIDMTRWRWPWQPNESIHFSVEHEAGTDTAPHEVVERATIVGPEGKVVLTSISE